jgi:Barstar (barnase inhibitor)
VAGAEVPPGWEVLVVPAGVAEDRVDLLDRFAEALRVPWAFGRNWDALDDVLRDLSWLDPADGYVVVLEGWAGVAERIPDDAEVVLAIVASAAEWRSEAGLPPLAVITG